MQIAHGWGQGLQVEVRILWVVFLKDSYRHWPISGDTTAGLGMYPMRCVP